MNKTAIKNFAISARITLIDAVTQRAFEYEITENGKNDTSLESVNGRALTSVQKEQRRQLIWRIQQSGFAQTMEEAAYTWFNRFIALRFMEINGYLPSRMRVFSDENGAFKPEILSEAMNVDIDGLNREYVLELLDLQDNDELYKYLIITQCNALNKGLPEMFERIGGWTELLFPNNLLRNDSMIAHMVEDIPEEDWLEQVQIIGWLYQYYNTQPKEQVFANLKKNIKISAENIPAATQLFTPDWIVRYMVENSLGRLWSDGHSDFDKSEWKYYLDEAEQEESVQVELAKLREQAKIKPEEIKFLDPCMGSGHVLVYAFDVLMQIYTSVGWSERDSAKSILQHNLYGLDIDKRAYQLAYFAVMMKARQYSRRILTSGVQPNMAHFQDISKADTSMLIEPLKGFVEQFRYADTYGSLMTAEIPDDIYFAIDNFTSTFSFERSQAEQMMRISKLLSQKYDVVCTNPPYMGGSGMDAVLSEFVKKNFADYKSDLFSAFIVKCTHFTKPTGYMGFLTPYVWMFIQSYEKLRGLIYSSKTIETLIQFEYSAFEEATVPICTFVLKNSKVRKKGCYFRLTDFKGGMEVQRQKTLEAIDNHECGFYYEANSENFSKIPGMPVAYWVSEAVQYAFTNGTVLNKIAEPKQGMVTRDNNRFMRLWWETDFDKMALTVFSHKESAESDRKWYPCTSGGAYRKWYGNLESVVNFEHDGKEIIAFSGSHIKNREYYFREAITWSAISSSKLSMRYVPRGFLPEHAGNCLYCSSEQLSLLQAFSNSIIGLHFLGILSPTLNYNVGDIASLPILKPTGNYFSKIIELTKELREESKSDYDSFETSWDFEKHPLI